MSIAVIVHGGAAKIEPDEADDKRAGCEAAARAAWEILEQGGSALHAVETAIRIMEDNPAFNAGYGSMLNADGRVRMDAGIMDGNTLQAGAVACIEAVRHPISVARHLLDEETVLMANSYAWEFATKQGLEICHSDAMIEPKQRQKWEEHNSGDIKNVLDKNTVGAVALDEDGNLVTGVSTGGTGGNPPGRVGDSACVGAGFYADNQAGASAMTGDGEHILRLSLAKQAVDFMRADCQPEQAAVECITLLQERVGGEAGCILIDQYGRIGWHHNAPNMACAYQTKGMHAPLVFLHKDEEAQRKETEYGTVTI